MAQIASELFDFATLRGNRGAVVGGSSGIGRAIALELGRAGADVLVHAGRRKSLADDVAEEVRRLGCRSQSLVADLSSAEAGPRLVAECWEQFGPLDFWVHNAGVDLLTTPDAKLDYAAKLQRLLDIDVRAAVLATKEVAQRMIAQGRGTILLIGWDQADRGMEGDSGELFAAAKNSLMGFTRSLALSVAPRVRVNCIAPGWIRTAWGEKAGSSWQERVIRETPLARWGEPEDIAKLARFLLSQDASYLTGQVINANGGAVR